MDPVSAFSLATNVCAFVDFTLKIVTKGHKLYKSTNGLLVEHSDIYATSVTLIRLNNELVKSMQEHRKYVGYCETETDRQIVKACVALNDIASELSSALEGLRLSHRHGRWESVRQALKAVIGVNKVEGLRSQLVQQKREVDSAVLRSIWLRLDDFFSPRGFKDERAPRGEIYKFMDDKTRLQACNHLFQDAKPPVWQAQLVDDTMKHLWTNPAAGHYENIATVISKEVKDHNVRNRMSSIIKQIRFDDMLDREHRITTAHESTLHWLFQGPSKKHVKTWCDFAAWLRSNNRIYWVTGKPGSGKSTLMKFLAKDMRTHQHLRAWSQSQPLITAHFYFWNSGSPVQMSLEGFYRTVIHAILASYPRLVERSLPLRWQAHELFGETRRPWSIDELKVAFLYLLNLSGKEFKLCLFVDGLDEYGGDHNAFVDEIFDMIKNSAVKLCLASRPWPVFDHAFSRKSHLMLQDLTFPDIVRFTWTNFSRSPAFRSRLDTESDFLGDLVLQVAHKSEGVFLWVHLVVKSLLEGITNADRVEDLQERLNELPGDLEELYWKMFQSIEPRYCAHASRYFQISLAATGQMSAFAFFLADSGDPSSSLSSPIQPISNDRRLQAYHAIKTRLASRCMGLLEIPLPQPTSQIVRNEPSEFHQAEQSMHAPGRNTGSRTQPQSVDSADLETSPALSDIPAVPEPDRKVTFLHRTVKDFLERADVRSEIASVGPAGFNPYLPMLGGYLRLLKTLRDEQVDRHTLLEFASTYLELVADAERQSCPIQDEYIDALDVVLTKLFLKYHLLPPGHHWTETRTTDTEPGFVAMTAEFNLGRYVRTKISTGSPVFKHTIERPLLDYIIQNCDKYPAFCENPTRPDGPLPSLEMITFMLDQKANPNDPHADSTVWGRLFDKVFEDWTATKSSERLEHWANMVDVLISHDADPRVNQDSSLGSKIRESFGSVFPG